MYPRCRCEDKKHMKALRPHVRGHLKSNSTTADLRDLCGGCTTWIPGRPVEGVCARLDYLRRRVGA